VGLRQFAGIGRTPLPVPDLRQILAVLVDVLFMLDELILELLLEVDAPVAGLRRRSMVSITRWKRSRSFSTVMSKGVVIVPSSL